MPSPTAGFLGYCKIGTSPTPTNKMSGVNDLSVPINRAMYDVTNMDTGSTNGWQQFISGLGSGKLAIKVNYDPSDTNGQVVAQSAIINGTLLYFIVSPNGTNTATFTGYVNSMSPHAPVNNKADSAFDI